MKVTLHALHARCIADVDGRSLSDHVQSTSGQPKGETVDLSPARVASDAVELVSVRVKTDLSKLKNRRRSGRGNGSSVDHAKRFFFCQG